MKYTIIATTIVPDERWHVSSETTPDLFYVVKRFSDGAMSCDCDAFYYSRETPRSCKHSRHVAAVYGFDTSLESQSIALEARLAQTRRDAHQLLTTGRVDRSTR